MFRRIFNIRLIDPNLYCNRSRLPLHFLHRFSTLRLTLIGLLLICLFFSLRFWGQWISFGQYRYMLGRERIIETRSSRFNNITVAQSGSLRMLRFDTSGVEGVIHLDHPHLLLFHYMRLQMLCLLWNIEPERILIIGLGAGILPRAFHYLLPNTLIDIVEVDSEVLDLTRKHFQFQTDKFVRVFVEDGRHFVERQPSHQYDVIIVDAFKVNGLIPHALRTLECLGEYLRILKPAGLVLANFLYEQESRYRQTYARALFKHIYRGVSEKNYVLIGLNKQAEVYNQDELQLRARALAESKSLPDVNWIKEVRHIHNGNDDKWNISALIFTDEIQEDFLGLSEGNFKPKQ